MKLSTEAKAGVMVAVSFLGLSGVLVGKKFLDPENPIEALQGEQKKPDAEGEKDNATAGKKPESGEPGDPKGAKDKNGEIVLAKNQVQTPGAFPPIGDTNPTNGAGKSPPPPDSNPFPPFNPVSGSNPGNAGTGIPAPANSGSGLPPIPGMENTDPSKNGNRALVKNDPPKGDGGLAFPLPQGGSPLPDNKSPSSLPGNPAPAPKSDLPPLNQGTSNAFPAFPAPTKGNEPAGTGVPGNLTNAQAGKNPLDPKNNLPTNDPKNPPPGGDPKSKSAFPDPFPPLPGGTNSPNSLPGSGPDNKFKDPGLPKPTEPSKNAFPDFPPLNNSGTTTNGAPSNLGGSSNNGGLGGLDNKKPAPFPMPTGDMGLNGDSRFPPPNNLPGDNSGLGRKPFPGDSPPPLNGSGLGSGNGGSGTGTGSLGNSNNSRTPSGFPGGSNLPGGDTLGNNNPFPRNDGSVIPANRPIAKPVVTTFSPLTGPTKRTEFTPLDDDPPPVAAPLNPARTNINIPAMNQPLGQPPGSLGQNPPSGSGFPLPGGSGLPGNSGLPNNSGLPGNPPRDPFPPVNTPNPFPQNNPLPGPGNPPPSGVKPTGSSTPPPSGFPSLDSASRTNRPEPFPLNSPATNGANNPVLKMPAEEKPLLNSAIQPTGLQMPSLNTQVAPAPGTLAPGTFGNSPGSFPGANSGLTPGTNLAINPRTNPAPANAPIPAPTNPAAFPAPTGKNLLNPKVSSWSEKVYQSAPGDSWETIAAREYQRNDLGRLLETYNGLHPRADALPKTGPLPAKTEVFLPPLDELIRRGTGEVPMNLFPPAKP